ncbi:hypothetical protein SDC9_166079 [bioreactor metagenome]|uniref:Uncharacterized protein n=1 Tax=bioreactor metagenome TaxID=1076179 RepID=A0A645FXW0_9ZZZZ
MKILDPICYAFRIRIVPIDIEIMGTPDGNSQALHADFHLGGTIMRNTPVHIARLNVAIAFGGGKLVFMPFHINADITTSGCMTACRNTEAMPACSQCSRRTVFIIRWRSMIADALIAEVI